VKFYDFSTLEPTAARTSETGPIVKIERLNAPPGLGGTNISMRWQDFRIESYRYHRWRASSSDLVTELMGRALAESGNFRRVDIDTISDDADVVLSGTILRFEGVGGPNGSVARVSIAITARRPGSQAILLSRQFDQEIAVRSHSIVALVSAFREGVVAIAADVSALVASLPAWEREEQVSRAK
jgi:ABC-type uncharacterized transport system auxiliary subunit